MDGQDKSENNESSPDCLKVKKVTRSYASNFPSCNDRKLQVTCLAHTLTLSLQAGTDGIIFLDQKYLTPLMLMRLSPTIKTNSPLPPPGVFGLNIKIPE